MIHFHTLGTLDLVDGTDGRHCRSVLAQPKRVGFLAYLAIAAPRGLHQRDTLLGIFWPDSSEKRARNSLNQSVFALRKALGAEFFTKNGEPGVGVDPDLLWCDVWEFEKALANGEKEEALDLYRGNFLEGFYLPGCLDFERWVDSERGRLRDLAKGAVLSQSQEMEAAGNPVGAVGWLRQARDWAAYDEAILQRQVELLLALGDRSGAVREYESFARRLSVDLGMEPSGELRELLNGPATPPQLWPTGGSDHDPVLSPGMLNGGRARSDPGPGRRSSFLPIAVVAFLAVALGVGGALWVPGFLRGFDSSPTLSGMETEIRTRVLVVPFENATGDPSLDPLGLVAAEAILQELAATGMASVGLSDPLGRHGEDVRVLPGGRDRNGDVAQGVAEADLLVTGTITIRGGELAFEAGILDAGSNTIVLAVEPVLGSTDNPTDASESLRNRLAGALAMALDPRLSGLAGVASYPPSYRAYQLLADGLGNRSREKAMVGDRERRGEMWEAASAAYLDAAALEPGFTLPLIFALDIPTSPFDSVLAVLRPLRDQLPRWERAMLDYYLAWDEADQFGQYRAMQRVVEISPTPDWTFRLAVKAVQINRPQEALQLLTQLGSEADWLEGQPDYWLWVADAELLLKDHESALEAVRQARSIRPDNPRLLALEVEALARSGREESAIQRSIEAVETTGHPGTHFLRYQLPQLLTVAGLEEEGQRVADVSLSSFSRMENLRIEYVSATYVAAGRFQEAREVLEDLSGLQPGRKLHAFTLLSFMAAREGRAEEAMGFAEMAASVYQVNGFDRAANGVMAQAQAAAHLGDRAGAVRFLLEAYRLGLPHGAYVFTRWDLRPLEGYGPFEDLMRPKG